MFRVEREGVVAVVRIDSPPVNALSFERWRSLPPLIRELEADAGVAAMVFTGLPHRHFCGGNDFKEFASLNAQGTSHGTAAVREGMRAVHQSVLPAIAAMHGAAMGSGFMLAAACDMRLATPDARMALPEVKVGAFGGYSLISQLMSPGQARWMTYTGRPIDGTRAYQLGIVQELADTPDAVLAAAIALAAEIGSLTKDRLDRRIKPVLNQLDRTALWDAYDIERLLAIDTMGVPT
jgi:enoyl-CoA hydratase/carnithine racemase